MSDATDEFHIFRESRPGLRPTWVAVLDGKRIVVGAESATEARKLARDWRVFFPTRPGDWIDYADHVTR